MTEPPAGTPPPHEHGVAEHPVEPELRCWRCAAPHDRFQEYCLECGARLVPLTARRGAVRREMWTRDSPFWFWATFLALLLIALVAGAIVLAATRDDDEDPRPGAGPGPTTSQLTEAPTQPPITTSTLPPEVTIPPPTTTATIPTLTTPPAPPPTTPPPPGPPPSGTTELIDWPQGRAGYTVILKSIPEGRGRGAAEAEGENALDQGLDEVGILSSNNFQSLNAGYWVVFKGIYDSEAQARADLPTVRRSGYPIAYIREITP